MYSAKKSYRRLLKYKKLRFRENILQQIQTLESSNPKEYWNLVNKLRSNSRTKKPSDVIDSDEWFSYFKTLNKKNKSVHKSDFEKGINFLTDNIEKLANGNSILDKQIELSEVLQTAKKLKNKKSAGIDSLTNEIIKSSLNIIGPLITKIFNIILNSGVFPKH